MTLVRETAPDRERAQHEAGHCVVAYMLKVPGFTVRYVTICEDASGSAGGTFNLDFDNATIDQWGVMLMAGVAAQMRGLHIRKKYEDDDPRMNLDWIRVWAQGKQDREVFFAKGGDPRRVQEYVDRALVLVGQGWGLIERVSFELIEHRTLYLDEFDMIAFCYEQEGDHSMMLDPYRRHRQTRDFTGKKWFDNFRKTFPELPWFEPVHEFNKREFDPAKEEPCSWYERLMGHPHKGD